MISSIAHIYATPFESSEKPLSCKINPANFLLEEIPTYGVYCFEFGAHQNLADVITNVRHFSWNRSISGQLLNNLSDSLQLDSPITVPLNYNLPDELVLNQLENNDISIPAKVIDEFHDKLSRAVQVRCGNHHNVCRKCFARYVKHNERTNGSDFSYSSDSENEMRTGPLNTINGITFRECNHASTAILFSGGIDSTVLALLANKFVPAHLPIDLLNVAFNNEAPDRETGLRAWEELLVLCPHRKWNFVSIHISKEELETYRSKHIRFLVKPSQTVLDDSIGCAVWFATRGKGLLMQEPGEITSFTCQTRARVVLLGMGADEQLGGYSRHRKVYLNHGWSGLLAEMTTDVERISSRYLGRDDRVTADHGIEARFPFLDELVINYLNGLPIWYKCNLNLERSKGEKLLLRLLAHRLGLHVTSQHLKRAIQFGSRIAKLEERTEKGDNICSRLSC